MSEFKFFSETSGKYGGFETIRSNFLSNFIFSKLTFLNDERLSTCCEIEFFFATAIAFDDLSTPIALALASSFNKDISLLPYHVPISNIHK